MTKTIIIESQKTVSLSKQIYNIYTIILYTIIKESKPIYKHEYIQWYTDSPVY